MYLITGTDILKQKGPKRWFRKMEVLPNHHQYGSFLVVNHPSVCGSQPLRTPQMVISNASIFGGVLWYTIEKRRFP